jgi:hypothetical protein
MQYIERCGQSLVQGLTPYLDPALGVQLLNIVQHEDRRRFRLTLIHLGEAWTSPLEGIVLHPHKGCRSPSARGLGYLGHV